MKKLFPLWMPPGSVRGALALGLVGSTIALVAVTGSAPGELWALDGAVIAWYFKKPDPPSEGVTG
jgi:hypothetical protein